MATFNYTYFADLIDVFNPQFDLWDSLRPDFEAKDVATALCAVLLFCEISHFETGITVEKFTICRSRFEYTLTATGTVCFG